MEGQQIPKATMTNFLKAKLKVGFSAEFINKILILSKDYINRLTEQANDVCTKNDKKTINAQHIESALINFGLESQLKDLKDMSSLIKQQNQIKQEFRQRIQENIQKNLQEIEQEDNQPRVVTIKQNIGVIEINNEDDSQQIDYEAQMQAQGNEKGQKNANEQKSGSSEQNQEEDSDENEDQN